MSLENLHITQELLRNPDVWKRSHATVILHMGFHHVLKENSPVQGGKVSCQSVTGETSSLPPQRAELKIPIYFQCLNQTLGELI